jgi:hypothetical protein
MRRAGYQRMAGAGESPIYRDLMRFKPEHLSPNAWAVQAGVSRTVWADMRRHGNPSRRTLEKLLAVVGSSLAEFEALRIGDQPRSAPTRSGKLEESKAPLWSPARLPPLPLIAASISGEWGASGSGIQVIELRPDVTVHLVQRPNSLAGDSKAYAMTIVGDSMWPRFRRGRRVAVSPAAPIAIGDDILLALKSDQGALIGELVKRTNKSVELRQFNPDATFAVVADEIEALHKIVGELF